MRDGCVFCDYDGPSEVLYAGTVLTGNDVIGLVAFPFFVIEPLDPVTPGHRLVIPRKHVADFRSYPRLLGAMMQAAADYEAAEAARATYDCNLIVSAGPDASQTVEHVHVHIVPRREGDGLRLPWSPVTETVFAVEWGNEFPAEVEAIRAREADALILCREKNAEHGDGGNWRVTEWKLR